jgi:hypothetical protein
VDQTALLFTRLPEPALARTMEISATMRMPMGPLKILMASMGVTVSACSTLNF